MLCADCGIYGECIADCINQPPALKSERQKQLEKERERLAKEKAKQETKRGSSLQDRQSELDMGNGIFTWDPSWTGNNLDLDRYHQNTVRCTVLLSTIV
jgi:hypothetical protein